MEDIVKNKIRPRGVLLQSFFFYPTIMNVDKGEIYENKGICEVKKFKSI